MTVTPVTKKTFSDVVGSMQLWWDGVRYRKALRLGAWMGLGLDLGLVLCLSLNLRLVLDGGLDCFLFKFSSF